MKAIGCIGKIFIGIAGETITNRLLALKDKKIVYYYKWEDGKILSYENKFDSIAHQMGRPIHPHMSIAPPWAKTAIVDHDFKVSSRKERLK